MAWVPVAHRFNDDFSSKTISIVSPGEALIVDDLTLSQFVSKVANGNLNFMAVARLIW